MHTQINEILEKFVAKTKANIKIDEIYLFGSYASNTQKPESDIDIAVIVPEEQDTYLKDYEKLFEIVSEVDFRIEPILLVRNHDKSGFIDTVINTGIKIS